MSSIVCLWSVMVPLHICFKSLKEIKSKKVFSKDYKGKSTFSKYFSKTWCDRQHDHKSATIHQNSLCLSVCLSNHKDSLVCLYVCRFVGIIKIDFVDSKGHMKNVKRHNVCFEKLSCMFIMFIIKTRIHMHINLQRL